MNILSWMNNRSNRLDIYDIALIKWCVFVLALAIAKVWEPILSLDLNIYLILALVFMLRPIYRYYFKKFL